MKRFAVAGATLILTTGLAVFAIAVAQRDSRERESALNHVEPEYANEASVPIAVTTELESGMVVAQPNEPPIFHETAVRVHAIAAPPTASLDPSETTTDLEEPPAFEPAGIPPLAFGSTPDGDPVQNAADVVTASGLGALPSPVGGNQPVGAPSLLAPPLGREAPPGPLPTTPLPPPSTLPTPGLINQAATPTANLMPPSLPSYPPGLTPPQNAGLSSRPQSPNGTTLGAPLNNGMGSSSNDTRSMPNNSAASMPLPPAMMPQSPSPSSAASSQTNTLTSPAIPSSGSDAANNPARLSSMQGFDQGSSVQPSPSPSLSPSPSPRNLPQTDPPPSKNQFQSSSTMTHTQLTSLASAAPGSRQMDGTQNPSLQIQKKAPAEVQVGQPATFGVIVRNVGNATAYDVSVVDSVPRGTRLAKTNPPADHRPDGTLVWSLGEMPAGTEQVLTVDLIPETEGEIGSVASVNFAAQASVRTVSTQPKLVVQQVADKQILVGKPCNIRVTVTNEGTGVARDVALEEDVPRGLRHPLGSSLGVPLGDLAPGQSKSTDLELIAIEPGLTRNVMRAVASNTGFGESTVEVEVVAPQLRVDVNGPKLRYLERQATYQVSVVNEGTSMAYDVEIVANLPRGLQYNSSGNYGEYLSDRHAIVWKLEELPVGRPAITEMTLLPVDEGEFAIRMQSSALGIEAEPVEKQVRIEGQSELAFSIDDDNDPIETNGQTTYLVRVTNHGTRVDEDVQLMIELPQGVQLTDVKAPVAFKETSQGIVFEPLGQMRAKDEQLFRFSVQFQRAGLQIVRAHLKSRLRPEPVVNEESTKVYFDQ